jgi:exonuclease V gamma subunit
MSVQKPVDDFFKENFKEKFPESFRTEEGETKPQENILDIYEFDDLIDAYADAQRSGHYQDRVKARRDLKDAYRVVLRAAGRSDR